MRPVCKITATIKLGRVSIPPLEVTFQKSLSLKLPVPSGSENHRKLVSALIGKTTLSGLDLSLPGVFADPFNVKFLEQPISNYLSESLWPKSLDSSSIFQNFQINRNSSISNLSFTGKCLLSLLEACLKSRFILFSTDGLDPCGEKKVVSLVLAKQQEGFAFLRINCQKVGDDTTFEASVESL